MTIKTSSSGSLSLAEIDAEFGLGQSLSSYRGVTWYTNAGATGTFSSTNLRFSDFYSKRKNAPTSSKTYDNTWTTSGTFTVPSNFVSLTSLHVYIVGGGGQGSGWPSGSEGGGGGEGAHLSVSSTGYTFTPGEQFTITIGSGGTSARTNGQSGNPGGSSIFGYNTILSTTARGGLGGSINPAIRSLSFNPTTVSGGIIRQYYFGGSTSGRYGVGQNAYYGAAGGASNCYDPDGNGIYDGGGTSSLNEIFSGTNIGRGGAGCGGGDRRISNQGYWPGGGGGGADYNATGGNGANGGIRVVMNYMGT